MPERCDGSSGWIRKKTVGRKGEWTLGGIREIEMRLSVKEVGCRIANPGWVKYDLGIHPPKSPEN